MKIKVVVGSIIFLLILSLGIITISKVKASGSPTVTSVTTSHADGYFKTGEVINIDITFSEAVNVSGNAPVLALNSGSNATYESGSGSTDLIFKYTVVSGDNSLDLSYLATSSLTTTGTIKSVFDDTNTTNDLPDPSIFLSGHAIVVDTASPSVVTLGNGSSDFTVTNSTSIDLSFSDSLTTTSKTAIQTALTNSADQAITYSWNSTSSVVTVTGHASNLTTFSNDTKISSVADLAGNTSSELLLVDSKIEANQVEPVAGTVIVNSATPQAVLTSPTDAVNVIVSHPVSNPSIDATTFVSNGTGVLPNITITIPTVASVNIATGTTITAASSSWLGIIAAPTLTTVTLDDNKTLSTAFEVGSTQSKLLFDKAVRIFVLNEGGKRVGYVDEGGSFVEVSTICDTDSQSWVDSNLGVSGDCKKDSGSDLIIWTKHFTKFAVYTQVNTCSPDSVANGNVSAYPTCAITCNSGYNLSGVTCVAKTYSNGGGMISAPVVSKNITSVGSVLLPIKLSLISSQAGNLSQSLPNNNLIKLTVTEDSVATKTDFSISSFAIGSLKPTKNLGEVLFGNNIFELTAINSNGLINNTLLKSVSVSVSYPELPSDLAGVGLYAYDNTTKTWSLVSDAVFSNTLKTISFSTNRLGEFAILRSADKTIVSNFILLSVNKEEIVAVAPVSSNYVAQVLSDERQNAKTVDKSLLKKLAGKIMLQVSNLGRAWYLDPISLERYYLADGQSSFAALRRFGLGIRNTDLAKIAIGVDTSSSALDSDNDGLSDKMEQALGTGINKADTDGDGFSDKLEIMNFYNPLGIGKTVQSKNLVDRLKGRIVLQTEGVGQAWYINPGDGKRYYLADGEAAYQIMRQLSLGITNDLISKIPVSK